MQKQSKKLKINNSGPLWWLIGGTGFVTLYFNPRIQDPFNSPKLWSLLVISAWLLGHIVSNLRFIQKSKNSKITISLIIFFILANLFSTLMSDNRYVSFFGENFRKNGFLDYLCLGIILISAVLFINFDYFNRIIGVSIFVGLVLSVYGLMQTTGNDFVDWANPYNAVIGTLGNPNFSAAMMAILATISFGSIFYSKSSKAIRVLGLITSALLLTTIYRSDARQGLISLAVGVGFLAIFMIYTQNKKLGLAFTGFGLIAGVFAILGMLQVGPLKEFLYKDSVSVRGYYWRAGIEMFKSNFWFGVGPDRYGANFKAYREMNYALTYGFDITSTNAHNVPIQIFATAGIFAGLAYISIIFFTIWSAIKGLRKLENDKQIALAIVFSGWLAFQAQSLVSIDNIGISVWGWLLSGCVIALSKLEQEPGNDLSRKNIKNQISIAQPLFSGAFLLIVLMLVVPLYRGEVNMYSTRAAFNPQNENNRSPLHDFAIKTINSPLIDPYYAFMSSTYLIQTGFIDEGYVELKSLNKSDPKNLDVLNYLAGVTAQQGNYTESERYRLEMVKLDPWNAKNYLALGLIYKIQNDKSNMEKMLLKIESYASSTPEAESARKELVL